MTGREERMIDIKRILVPIDFSEPSRTALNYGLSLALQFNARLVLAHVVPPNVGLVYTFPTESFAFEKDQARYAKSMLPTLIPAEYMDRLDLQTIVKVGVIQDELLAVVKDEKIDIVVMGTHGRNAFERFLLGSLTEKMLRKVPVPILTVSHLDAALDLHTAGPVSLRKILYATDLSDSSDVGLRVAFEIARGTGASVTVLHVLQALETIYWGAEGGFIGQELKTIQEETFKRLQTSMLHGGEGVAATPIMVEGEPFREILNVAEEEKSDLIVLNLQGKGLVERALLGSTAERVIRSAHVPVLSIPVPAEYATRVREMKSSAA
jgi:nucleotide-binding universal stress UspA family protein